MIHNWMRVIRDDNGTYTDASLANSDNANTILLDIVATEDALFIGKVFPFNNFHAWTEVANEAESVMTVSYWDGTQWRDAVDLLDGSSLAGATLGQNGTIQFSPNKEYGWQIVGDTSETSNTPTELQSLTIYNLYWIKITFSDDLDDTTEVKSFGYCFTNDQALNGIDIDLSNYLTPFNQTDWTKQIRQASEEVVIDLQSKGLVLSENQIIRFEDVYLPTAYRTLSLIYFSLGEDYNDRRKEVLNQYQLLLKSKRFTFDTDNDAFLSRSEVKNTISQLIR